MRTSIGRSRSILARAAMAAAALVSVAGFTVAVPATAHAAGAVQAANSCWSGPNVTDWRGRTFKSRTCPTWTGTWVYSGPYGTGDGATVVGYLNAANNWVVCQTRGGGNPRLGGNQNTIWLYTQGDTTQAWPERKAWGWIPATAVSYGADNAAVPGVPMCDTYPGQVPS
ncbi:hypothetical protein [Streptosporangium sp. CA-115845]|uniref:hypothetical protein n=1 Tax=Streptosporangium sp. CA-115845 TaxID=3240071 RepID=UPI003D8EEAA6